MATKNNVLLLFIFVGLIYVAQSQSFVNRINVGLSAEISTLLPHHKMMYPLAEQKFKNVSADFYYQPPTLSYWRNVYYRPQTGISFLFSEMSSEKQLGNAYALMPFMKFSIGKSQKVLHKFYFGCGIGYLTKTFDRIDNYKNIAIGSHLNAALRLFYMFDVPISSNFAIESGIGITHFSNGAISLPNRGANQMSVSLGIKYLNNPLLGSFSIKDSVNFHPTFLPCFYLFTGIKQLYLGENKKYFAYSLGSAISYEYSKLKAGVIGIDIFYDSSENIYYQDIGVEKSKFELLKSGVYIGHQWYFNRLTFGLNFGAYLYAENKVGGTGDFYNRLILRYRILPQIELNSSIKAHFAKADYIEWGVVYKPSNFLKKKND